MAPEQLETLFKVSANYLYACIHLMILFAYRCRHANIVDVMGFCVNPPIIMYEYMDYDRLHNEVCVS